MSGDAPTTDPLATRTAAPRASGAAGDADDTLVDRHQVEPATRVGRFTILHMVGAGGMGQVYAAYDPQLDRRVALKLLLTPDDELATRRLVREAQALARLSHPNVVAVHEVGSHNGRVFVAMEFVDGETLKTWAHINRPGEPSRQRRALELLVDAARGLAAAHAAGLVHRDVKPGNILVGSDGRVRVVDFGLARADDDALPAQALESSLSSSQSEGALVGAALTRTGAIAGTPAYMAPEQLTGEPISAATDQFGFCVTAWEVLFGRRPFEGGAIVALLQEIIDGRVSRPEGIEVPAAVDAALRRGLQRRPKRRHRDMDALVAVLRDELRRLDGESPPPRNRSRWMVGSAAVLGLAAGLGAWSLRTEGPRCQADPSLLAGVWDDARKAEIEPAVLGAGVEFADETWSRLVPAIDAWRDEWLSAHRDACEATHVRGEQSPELLDLRMQCLKDRRVRFQAFLGVLAEGGVDAIAEADDAFADLPPIGRCADARYVRATGEALPGPVSEALAAAVSAQIARAAALQRGGLPESALATATIAAQAAEDLGEESLLAHAHLRLGSILVASRQYDAGRQELETAYVHSRRADLPEVSSECGSELARVNGISLSRFSEGRWWLRIARLDSERVPDEIDILKLDLTEAALLRAEGHLSDAAAKYDAALDALKAGALESHPLFAGTRRVRGELELVRGQHERGCQDVASASRIQAGIVGERHPSMAAFHLSSAMCERLGGDLEAAVAYAAQALAVTQATFGPHHKALTPVLDAIAVVLTERGDPNGAVAMLERAIELRVPAPQDPVTTARLLSHEGTILLDMQKPRKAEEIYRRAFELSRAALGDHHPQTARARIDLGATLDVLGKDYEAIAWIQAGLAVDEAVLGSEHPDVALVHDVLASTMERRGDLAAALDHSQRAFEIFLRAYGPDAHAMIKPHGNLCAVLGTIGRPAEAAPHCERALELAQRSVGADPSVIAALHNSLGTVLFASGDHDGAQRHYSTALQLWRENVGDEDFRVAIGLANLAEVRLARGDREDALDLYSRSLSLREALLGRDHPALVVPLVGAASARLQLGDLDEARDLARRAQAICAASPVVSALVFARAEETLARVLWPVARHRAESIRLARSARVRFHAAGGAAKKDLSRIEEWMEGRGISH